MILASQSPRRIELMREAGFDVRVKPADIDETPLPHEEPLALVERLARAKAAAVAENTSSNELILAADTIVTVDGRVLGKPRDPEEAKAMLRLLSGRTHHVATGVCLDWGREARREHEGHAAHRRHEAREAYMGSRAIENGSPHDAPGPTSFVTITEVTFFPLTDDEIERYVASGEPMDKAGAYGIQGVGGRMLVSGINGDFYNVVGLPIAEVTRRIRAIANPLPC